MSETQGRDLVPVDFDPFAGEGDLQRRLPLTPQQIEVWVESQMGHEASCAYNQCFVLHLRGPLSAASMTNALSIVIGRHSALRTTFNQEATAQRILPSLQVAIPVKDLAGLSTIERRSALDKILEEETTQPFDLAKGPLVRARLVRESADRHVLVLTVHHIVCDGWSSTVLFSDLAAAYAADRFGLLARLPAAMSYESYVEGEVARTDAAADETYWLQQFADGVPVLNLPSDRKRPSVRTRNGARETLGFEAAMYKQLKAVGAKNGATLFHTLLAAFETLVFRLSNQADWVIGMPIAGQLQLDNSHLVAHCVSTLPLRCRIAQDSGFSDFLKHVRTGVLDAQGHSNFTFSRLLPNLKVDRDLSSPPLVSIVFNVDKLGAKFNFGDLVVERVETPKRFVTFDLAVNVVDSGADLSVEFDYNTDLFDALTIKRWLSHFKVLLTEIVRDPSQTLARIDILGEEERQRLLVGSRPAHGPRSDKQLAGAQLVHCQFEAQVLRSPTALALVAGEVRLDYDELNKRANRLAHYLRVQGIGQGDLVGVRLERTADLVVTLLAVLKAGGAYLPLDPAYPQDRVAFMLEDARAKVLVTEEPLALAAPPSGTISVLLDRHQVKIATHPVTNLEPLSTPADLAYVIYTSGSTGKPKGVQVTHANVCRLFSATQPWFEFGPHDVWTLFHSYAFDFSVWELWGALLYGGRLVVVPYWVSRDPSAFRKMLVDERVTVLNQTPSAFRQLIQADLAEVPASYALRTVIFGGEALELHILKPWFERYGDQRPQLVNMYGITETTVHVTYRPITLADVESGQGSVIGEPIPDLYLRLVDTRGELVPVGVPGEIWVGGAGVARGYLNRPELTAERFINDPFDDSKQTKVYRSGDLARRLANGDLEFLGRIDAQVKIRGFRIELGEIEAALAACPEVADAAVIVREDTEGDKRLVAYVVSSDVGGQLANTLRSKLAEKLPSYMVPAHFVPLDALPLNANGKLDRAALPAPQNIEQASSKDFVGPKTPTEEAIVGIWRKVLKVSQIDCTNNFFLLGGHSLLATQVASRLRDVFQIEFPLSLLFTDTTVQALGRRIDQMLHDKAHAAVMPKIEAKVSNGPERLSLSQERMWLINKLAPDNKAYNISIALRLRGQLDRDALSRAIDEMRRRHETLRTTYHLDGAYPVQIVAPWTSEPLEMIDRSSLGAGAWNEALRLAHENASEIFDLERSSALRSLLLRIGGEDHLIVLTIHHIAIDDWGQNVFANELTVTYNSIRAGRSSDVSPLPITYRDYAAWQRHWISGESDRQLAFWRKQLTGITPLELPIDHARPEVFGFKGNLVQCPLPETLVSKLEELGHGVGATLFMVMFGAFANLLHRLSGQDDITVAVPIANRTQSDVEHLVGTFVNTLALRTNAGGNPSFKDFLGQVRRVSLDAYAHQDISFEKLVEEFGRSRDASRPPLAQVLFNLLNAPIPGFKMDGLDIQIQVLDLGATQFELGLSIDAVVTRKIYVEYNSELFDRSTIERLVAQYVRMLERVIANPDIRIDEIPLQSEAEQHQVVRAWNQTQAEYPSETVFSRLFEESARQNGSAVALSSETTQLSYTDLNARANRLAHRLKELGAGGGTFVALCVPRSFDLVVSLLAIQKSGAAYVPLDPGFPADRLTYMLADSGASILITMDGAADEIEVSDAVNVVDLPVEASQLKTMPATNLESAARPGDVAYVIYTSGSTGKPKGVQVPHGALVNFLWSMKREPGLTSADVLAAVTTISFDIAGLELYLPLLVGARIEMVSREVASEGTRLAALLEDCSATVLQATPATWRMLLDDGWKGRKSMHALCGGESLPRDLANALLERVGELWNLYGPTETTVWSTVEQVKPGEELITIGRPIANTQIYVMDKAGQPQPVGVPGEIWIGGDGVAVGYHLRPELTAEKFVSDRFSERPNARVYRTGDLGRWLADGRLQHLGRFDHQVKIRGFRIELGEIETQLNLHPAVRQSAVITREARPGDVRIIAYVVVQDGEDLTASEVRRHLRSSLPDYMVPSFVLMVPELPLTANGKLDRASLPDPFKSQTQDVAVSEPPAPGMEQRLAEIWKEALKIDAINAGDNFFELGGHSLLAVRVAAALEKQTGWRMNARVLFFQTLRQVAASAEAATLQPMTERVA